MGFRFERWTLRLASLPLILRYCPQCKDSRAFACSEKFRVNAQKKVLDVWLLYRCVVCDLTWKLPIRARCHVARIDQDLRERFESNDADTAQRFATDARALNGHILQIDPDTITVARQDAQRAGLNADTIRLEIVGPCAIRLDRLLSRELGIARQDIVHLHEAGRIHIDPLHPGALQRRALSGQEIAFVDGLRDASSAVRIGRAARSTS